MRRLVLLPALLAILVGAPPALAWTWPVDGPVLQSFVLGDDPYAPGQHRGIDVGTAEGVPVRAPASGTVTFAGTVPGGGRTITIQTPDGLAVTLLHLGAVLVAEGHAVAEGADIGAAGWSGDPEHPVASVHLGVRVAAETAGYLDPLSLLPPPVSNDVVAGSEPDEQNEPATVPVAADERDEATAAPVEGETLPSQPEEARAMPEPLLPVAQADPAEPDPVDVTPLEPLVVVSAGTTAPSSEGAVPAAPVAPEAPGRAHPITEVVVEQVEATLPAAASPPGDPTAPPEAAALAASSAPTDQPDARRDGRRGRAPGRPEPADRPHRARIDRRADPVAEAGVAASQGELESVEHWTRGLPRQPERVVAPVSVSSGGAWFRRLGLPAIIAIVASVLLVRRAGRGGQKAAVRETPPSVPPLGAAQGAEPSPGVVPAGPATRRDAHAVASRPGRRLDRGGPGRPVKRPAGVLRGRRASV